MITLATLPQATERDVFEQVQTHLLTQNKTSKDELGIYCVYKSKEGLKCAAGCLIADNEYSLEMEGKSWYSLIEEKLVSEKHHLLIQKLQSIHDIYPPFQWEQKLNELETTFKIK